VAVGICRKAKLKIKKLKTKNLRKWDFNFALLIFNFF